MVLHVIAASKHRQVLAKNHIGFHLQEEFKLVHRFALLIAAEVALKRIKSLLMIIVRQCKLRIHSLPLSFFPF